VLLPVPLEEIVEQVLGLDFDWDVIEEQPGEQILGGLDAKNRKILLNEAHIDLFDEKPGLLRSTIGHEAGHWELDVDRAKLSQPMAVPIHLGKSRRRLTDRSAAQPSPWPRTPGVALGVPPRRHRPWTLHGGPAVRSTVSRPRSAPPAASGRRSPARPHRL
jgi:hypothetical protein